MKLPWVAPFDSIALVFVFGGGHT